MPSQGLGGGWWWWGEVRLYCQLCLSQLNALDWSPCNFRTRVFRGDPHRPVQADLSVAQFSRTGPPVKISTSTCLVLTCSRISQMASGHCLTHSHIPSAIRCTFLSGAALTAWCVGAPPLRLLSSLAPAVNWAAEWFGHSSQLQTAEE